MFKLSYVELVTGIKASRLAELIKKGVLSGEERDGVMFLDGGSVEKFLMAEGRFIPDVFRTNIIRVLVVDDEPNMLNALKRLFNRFPQIVVTTASNAFDMGHSLRTVMPDIIILDYSMPGMDGLEILETLKADGSLDKVHVIVYTGKLPEDMKYVFEEFENVKVLAKSADFKELLLTLEKMVNEKN